MKLTWKTSYQFVGLSQNSNNCGFTNECETQISKTATESIDTNARQKGQSSG